MRRRLYEYEVGLTILINHIDDPYTNLDGVKGKILFIDGKKLLHGTWGGVALIPEIDDFQVINEKKHHLYEHTSNTWQGYDFYDDRCKLKDNNGNNFYITYTLNFIDEDFNYDGLTIKSIVDFDTNTPSKISRSMITNFLFSNYYEEIKNGFIHAIYDDLIADYWIDEYKNN